MLILRTFIFFIQFLCWMWLQIWFIGLPNPFSKTNNSSSNHDRNVRVRRILRNKYDDLGAVNAHEAGVLVLFTSLVALWFFRDPKFMTGWGNFVHVE